MYRQIYMQEDFTMLQLPSCPLADHTLVNASYRRPTTLPQQSPTTLHPLSQQIHDLAGRLPGGKAVSHKYIRWHAHCTCFSFRGTFHPQYTIFLAAAQTQAQSDCDSGTYMKSSVMQIYYSTAETMILALPVTLVEHHNAMLAIAALGSIVKVSLVSVALRC
jgi:hypothetical protein